MHYQNNKSFEQLVFLMRTERFKVFKKVRYYVDKCVDFAYDPYEACYNDLFNSDYVWA